MEILRKLKTGVLGCYIKNIKKIKQPKAAIFFLLAISSSILLYCASYCALLPQLEKTVATRKMAYMLYEPIELLRAANPIFWKWTERGYLFFGGKQIPALRYYFKTVRRDFFWHDNGSLRLIIEWRDGKLDGVITYYYSNGRIECETHMRNGFMHGERITYAPTGKIMDKQYYIMGIPHGEWYMYYKNGKILQKGEFNKGDGEVNAYLQSGDLIAHGIIKNGKLNGTFLDINAQNVSIISCRDGKAVDITVFCPLNQYLRQMGNWNFVQ